MHFSHEAEDHLRMRTANSARERQPRVLSMNDAAAGNIGPGISHELILGFHNKNFALRPAESETWYTMLQPDLAERGALRLHSVVEASHLTQKLEGHTSHTPDITTALLERAHP